MEDNCQSNSSHDTCNLSRVGAPGWVKQMEMGRSKDSMSTRRRDFCISTRSMNRPSCEMWKMSWLKNMTWISARRGASILVTRLFKYSLVPRNLKWERAGRTTNSPGNGDIPMSLGWEAGERKWSERD